MSAGTTVLRTTQYLEEIYELCDSVAVLRDGSIVERGTPAELRSRIGRRVLEIWLADPGLLPQLTHIVKARGLVPQVVGANSEPRLHTPIDPERDDIAHVLSSIADAAVRLDGLSMDAPTLDETFDVLTVRPQLSETQP